MANTYLYAPGTTPLLKLNGVALTNVTEVFFALRVVVGAGTPVSYVVGVTTPGVADALGRQAVTDVDNLIALRPGP